MPIRDKAVAPVLALVLAVVTLALYWQVMGFDFVNYDDPDYVSANPFIQQGFSKEGVIWAFTRSHSFNWHPVTWFSHMLDCQMFGPNAGRHHFTNVLLHTLNVLLVFFLFKKMTGAIWRSGFVAMVFAFHPLHVESVAWVCERKDVLSTFFWLLTMWAYARYAMSRVEGRRPALDYSLALFFCALGLMSKPMLVTTPFLLLLLDYWPLGRLLPASSKSKPASKTEPAKTSVSRLILEKVPFLALAVASSITTFLVQRREGAVADMQTFPLTIRLGNAFISYVRYLGKTFWPSDLIVFYPYPEAWPVGMVLGSLIFLVLVSGAVFWVGRKHRSLFVGWFWFLGTLVPVIGIVQVGIQSMADRYMYVPIIGLSVMAAWGCQILFKTDSYFSRYAPRIAFGSVTVACLFATHGQLRHWRNSQTLFEHAIARLPDNVMAYVMLGNALNEKGDLEGALHNYTEALKRSPNFPEVHFNIGNILIAQQKAGEAIPHYEMALRVQPDYAEAHANLGVALGALKKYEEAIAHYREAIRLRGEDPDLLRNLSIDLATLGRFSEATDNVTRALQMKPDDPNLYTLMGDVLVGEHRYEEAIVQYSKAIQIQPNHPDASRKLEAAKARLSGNAVGNR